MTKLKCSHKKTRTIVVPELFMCEMKAYAIHPTKISKTKKMNNALHILKMELIIYKQFRLPCFQCPGNGQDLLN